MTQTAAPLPTQTAYPTSTPYPTPTTHITVTDTIDPEIITWSQLMDFVLQDHTNWLEYSEMFNCVNFSLELAKNANKAGINAWVVAVMFENSLEGHTFVAFQTVDRGIIWVEPQSDSMYAISKVGERLCLANNPNLCWEDGLITNIISPAHCNPVSHECK